jgi:hypothetical protein
MKKVNWQKGNGMENNQPKDGNPDPVAAIKHLQ